jgi:hypothetical protein
MPSSTLADTATLTMTAIREGGNTVRSDISLDGTLSNGPQRFPYLFRNIRHFPRRLFHPPNPSVPRVGTVRSLKLTPCYRVSLEDVINGRHLPPLGRKEFEDFLYFKVNLYPPTNVASVTNDPYSSRNSASRTYTFTSGCLITKESGFSGPTPTRTVSILIPRPVTRNQTRNSQ